MNKQITLSALFDELAQAKTKKKEFLAQVGSMVAWEEWMALIRPHYYKGERGNKPYELELMLRLYLIQNLYDLSDMATAEQAIDSRAFSSFCGIDSSNQVPDGDTIGRFRNLLTAHGLQEQLFAQVVAMLTSQGLMLKKGTIVDSSIISAPSSTKNRERKRDPEAHQTRKGNAWYFGYKTHIGVDKDSGLVHHAVVTAANEHDVNVASELLTGEEESVYGDSGYLGMDKRVDALQCNGNGRRIDYQIKRRPTQIARMSPEEQPEIRDAERHKSSVRSKVEHVFGVIKGLFKYRRTRYRGLHKQAAKLYMLYALANLHLAGRRCLTA